MGGEGEWTIDMLFRPASQNTPQLPLRRVHTLLPAARHHLLVLSAPTCARRAYPLRKMALLSSRFLRVVAASACGTAGPQRLLSALAAAAAATPQQGSAAASPAAMAAAAAAAAGGASSTRKVRKFAAARAQPGEFVLRATFLTNQAHLPPSPLAAAACDGRRAVEAGLAERPVGEAKRLRPRDGVWRQPGRGRRQRDSAHVHQGGGPAARDSAAEDELPQHSIRAVSLARRARAGSVCARGRMRNHTLSPLPPPPPLFSQ